VWKPPGGLSENFLCDAEYSLFIKTLTKSFTRKILLICYHFMKLNVPHVNVQVVIKMVSFLLNSDNVLYFAVITT
jgi:hypothetical protein